jgi:hypothetical protein
MCARRRRLQQDVARRCVQQHTDTAGSVAGEIHEGNGPVAEEMVAAREGQDRRTVEVIVDRRTALKRVANPSHWSDGSCCDPVVFGPVQIYGQSGQIKKSARMVPVCCVGKVKSMSAVAYPCSSSADTVGTTSAAGRTAALSTAGVARRRVLQR